MAMHVTAPVLNWGSVPWAVQRLIYEREGNVNALRHGPGDGTSALALRLKVGGGAVYVKAVAGSEDDTAVVALRHEARVVTLARRIAPVLRWQGTAAERGRTWHLTAFDAIHGRAPDLTPDSTDLDLVGETLRAAASCEAPRALGCRPLVEQFADATPSDARLLSGGTLVHGRIRPSAWLLDNERAWLTGWGHAVSGPPWADAADTAALLVTAGCAPQRAISWSASMSSWVCADPHAVRCFLRLRSSTTAAPRRHAYDALRAAFG